jgi:hypothetical protein
MFFWPSYRGADEPDLLMYFNGPDQKALLLIVETKLWSEKSSSPGGDQLVRYLSALGDLSGFNVPLPGNALIALVYLTPRDSREEVSKSVGSSPDPLSSARLIFRCQWQDIIAAARRTMSGECTAQTRMILQDVVDFLSRRNLEYFRGFARTENLPLLSKRDGRFLSASSHFVALDLPVIFVVEESMWTR